MLSYEVFPDTLDVINDVKGNLFIAYYISLSVDSNLEFFKKKLSENNVMDILW